MPINQFLICVIIGSANSKFLSYFEMIQTLPIHRNKYYVAPRLTDALLYESEVKTTKIDGIIILTINYAREVIYIKGDDAQFFCLFEYCSP